MPILQIRFYKYDQYQNPIFIASDNKNESKTYCRLINYYNKLKSFGFETYLPIYYNEKYKYCTIRFKKSSIFKYHMAIGDIYDIEYKVKQSCVSPNGLTDKTYLNCYASKIKKVSSVVDNSVEIDLDE